MWGKKKASTVYFDLNSHIVIILLTWHWTNKQHSHNLTFPSVYKTSFIDTNVTQTFTEIHSQLFQGGFMHSLTLIRQLYRNISGWRLGLYRTLDVLKITYYSTSGKISFVIFERTGIFGFFSLYPQSVYFHPKTHLNNITYLKDNCFTDKWHKNTK